jgi:hypothetical protein
LRDPAAQQEIRPGSENWQVRTAEGLAFPCVRADYEVRGTDALVEQCRTYLFRIDDDLFEMTFTRPAPPGSAEPEEWEELIQHVVRSVRRG